MRPTNHKPVPGLAIMMTSHPKQQVWLRQTLDSFWGCPYPIYLGYDDDKIPAELQRGDIKGGVYTTGRPAGQLGHARGELFQMRMLIHKIFMDGHERFYKTAGDCVHYRWRGFAELERMLARNRWEIIHKGTSMIYGHTEPFLELMHPWTPETKAGSAEIYLGRRMEQMNTRNLPLEKEQWERILGRIHVQGEFALNQGIQVKETWKMGEIWK